MISVFVFSNQTIAVLGLGRTGTSAAMALTAGGARVLAWDDDPLKRKAANKAGVLTSDPEFYEWQSIDALVLSPGIPHTFPTPHPIAARAKESGAPIISDIEVFARTRPEASLVGVTGTNGKSTTTALIAHILREAKHLVQVGGNIGTGVLSLEALPPKGAYVFEMSSYQLELTHSVSFDAAVLLNIMPDHIARHGSFKGYIAAKERIFRRQRQGQIAVIGLDDPQTEQIYQRLLALNHQIVVGISGIKPIKGGIFIHGHYLIDDTLRQALKIIDLRETAFLSGLQNGQNIAAAYAVCQHRGLLTSEIIQGLRTFKGLKHRQEIIDVIDGVTYINDSKATNPASVSYALNNYDNIFWIVGGRPKSDGLTGLLPYYPKIKHAFIIGEALEDFSRILENHMPITKSETLVQAVRQAHDAAKACQTPHPIVLLSPACESFDQFKDFENRGELFKTYVEELPGGRSSIGNLPFLTPTQAS